MQKEPKMLVLWLVLIALPIVTAFVALGQVPAGVDRVPTHWDFAGNVDGWGEPSGMLVLGFIMAGTNLLVAVCYAFTEPMQKAGLVHGVKNPETARKLLLATGVFIVLLNAGIFSMTVRAILSTL